MKKILLIIAILSSFMAPLFCSEKSENHVVIYAKVNTSQLRYTGKKSIDKCKSFNIPAEYNSPCFAGCQYNSTDIVDPNQETLYLNIVKTMHKENLPENFKEMEYKNKRMVKMNRILKDLGDHEFNRVIPWHCFMNDKFNYKSVEATLFSFVRNIEGEDIIFDVRLGSDFLGRNPQDDIDNFRNYIVCTYDDEQELLESGIIAKDNGKLLKSHGINSYFADEIKAKAAERWALFYSRLKSCLKKIGIVSFAAIIAYFLYQKLYKTS